MSATELTHFVPTECNKLPGTCRSKGRLARFYERLGELEKAISVYAEVLKIDPTYKGIIEKIKELAEW